MAAPSPAAAAQTTRGEWLLIPACLLISGACGLVYEIVWTRQLTLVVGSTLHSISTVLGVFMGGLALGSYVAGRIVSRLRSPLRAYAVLEAAIGLYALVLPLLLMAATPLFGVVYQEAGGSSWLFLATRVVVCGILLLIPTTLMGATLPILVQHLARSRAVMGRTVAVVYGMNTTGAMLGAFGAGFLFIPAFGMMTTSWGAAAANFAVAAVAWRFARPSSVTPIAHGGQKQANAQSPDATGPVPSAHLTVTITFAMALAGAAAMIFQIAWTRALALSIGGSVYAFSIILTAFIFGLGLGSLAISRFIDRIRQPVVVLALAEGVIAIAALATVPILGRFPLLVADTVFKHEQSFQHVQVFILVAVLAVLLVPTFLMGAALPLAARICIPAARQAGRYFANVYAANTLGTILGSIAAGFLLIPWIGTQNTIVVGVFFSVAAATTLFAQSLNFRPLIRVAVPVALVGLLAAANWLITAWDRVLLTSGPFLYADAYWETVNGRSVALEVAMKDGRREVFFKEGLHAVVSVKKTEEGDLALDIGGKTDASAKGDAATQLMLGHLPLLLHPGAENVLIVGLGSGMTLGAVVQHPVNAVDVVEIEQAVVDASDLFREANHDALDDPRANLIVADGRNHLTFTRKQYDIIISEPSNPWVSGMSSLFTREYFQLASDHLQKSGLMSQWLHAYSMSSTDFKTMVRTFHTIFPHTTLWEASLGGDYVLIGSRDGFTIDYETLSERLRDTRINADLRTIRITGFDSLFGKLLMADDAIARYTDGVPLHTDDNSLLEYAAPKALFERGRARLLRELYAHRMDPESTLQSLGWATVPDGVASRLSRTIRAKELVVDGMIGSMQGSAGRSVKQYQAAIALAPKDYDATFRLAKIWSQMGGYRRAEGRPDEAADAFGKSISAIVDFTGGTGPMLSDHFELEVLYAHSHLELGIIALEAGSLNEAEAAFRESLSTEVRYAQAHNNLGVVSERAGDYEQSLAHYERALRQDPTIVSARTNIGNILLRQNKHDEAIQSYQQAQKLRPDFAPTSFNLGVAYFKLGDWDEAEKAWERALKLDPKLAQAQRSLDTLRNELRRR